LLQRAGVLGVSRPDFPHLDAAAITTTKDALHDYARVVGAWCKSGRRNRKHWWHASLRPSLTGLTTDVIYGAPDFEIELDLINSRLDVKTATGTTSELLCGQPSAQIASMVKAALLSVGVAEAMMPADDAGSDTERPEYSAEQASSMQRTLASVVAAMEDFRAGIREETSPIQLWPHHFDLSMIWLPGPKVEGQVPADEEFADKQMNFGFTFGDTTIPEPYFYVTAYPLPDGLPEVPLPPGTEWRSEGFSGAVLLYRDLVVRPDPDIYLLDLWNGLLEAGRDIEGRRTRLSK
jgi:hypothetical protein